MMMMNEGVILSSWDLWYFNETYGFWWLCQAVFSKVSFWVVNKKFKVMVSELKGLLKRALMQSQDGWLKLG